MNASRRVPDVLLRRTEVAHHVVDSIATARARALQRRHLVERRDDFGSYAAGRCPVPRAVRQIDLYRVNASVALGDEGRNVIGERFARRFYRNKDTARR